MSARAGSPQTVLDRLTRLVKRMELFRDLSLSECGQIAMGTQERVFQRGETIFRDDDPVGFVYAVASGPAAVGPGLAALDYAVGKL